MKIKVDKIPDTETIVISAWKILEDGTEKKLPAPLEMGNVDFINNPTEASILYWKAHGIDREKIRFPEI